MIYRKPSHHIPFRNVTKIDIQEEFGNIFLTSSGNMKQCNAQPSQKAQVELRAGKIHATLFNQKNPLLNFDTILLEQLEYKKDIHIQKVQRFNRCVFIPFP